VPELYLLGYSSGTLAHLHKTGFMRILMTGFTALQINTERRTIQKIDVPASIVKALEECGHEVDWRRVTPGEDLSMYDVAWVNLAPLNSLNGRQGAMGALYVLGSGVPAVGFFDDWQFSSVFNGCRALKNHPELLYKYLLTGQRGDEGATYFSYADAEAAVERIRLTDPEGAAKCGIGRYFFNDTDENIKQYEGQLVAAATSVLEERWAQGMIPACPMYSFGDRSLVRKRMPAVMSGIEALDPSSTIYDILATSEPKDASLKERKWVLGALMPHDTWLEKKKPEWPVEIIGSRKLIKKFGGQRLDSEADVLSFYNDYWGILSPPYPHAGSGWWRSRFMYAARVGSILVTDKGEGNPLGKPYKLTIKEVEAMSDTELAEAAKAQGDALRPYMPDYSSFVEHCNRIVHRALAEDKGLKFNPDGTR
jgi:hypothetical protein